MLRKFREFYGYELPFRNPEKHSERIYRRKLVYPAIVSRLADKYQARQYVSDIVGDDYLVPCLGVVDKLSQEFFEALPQQFVLKATHGSGFNLLVRDANEYSYSQVRAITDKWLKTKFYLTHQEFHYKPIKPRLIAEQLLLDDDGDIPIDYKCNYFDNNGTPKIYILVISDRHTDIRNDVFDEEWRVQPITLDCPNSDNPQDITKPDCLQEMLDCTATLAKPFAFVRVDFYIVKNQLYFGELTFTPQAGNLRYSTSALDAEWGRLWGNEKIH